MERTSAVYAVAARANTRRCEVSILIVDRQPILRKGLRALFEVRPEWTIVGEACSGLEAIELAGDLQPDLVVSGISMPELNGIDALPRILKASPLSRVLIFSTHTEEELIKRALAAGALAYVLKSDAEMDLLNAVEAVLRRRVFLSQGVARRIKRPRQNRTNADSRLSSSVSLTQREREVVQLLSEGCGNKQVADRLGISIRTAENHRARLMKKLGVGLRGLVRYAVRNNIIQA